MMYIIVPILRNLPFLRRPVILVATVLLWAPLRCLKTAGAIANKKKVANEMAGFLNMMIMVKVVLQSIKIRVKVGLERKTTVNKMIKMEATVQMKI